ncbi:MAG: transporter substrate-binding domain-containing protein [Lachnospiraceae bacterium]|nr:transporter substrate-binding domain-containing protein [Lachnospiraceae bacterium]
MKKRAFYKWTKRCLLFVLCVVFLSIVILPGTSFAKEPRKSVRVGWYVSPFNEIDQFGRRSGYAYEYQRKIADYTGWEYEYVEGTWPELLEKLKKGEIDLLSDVSYTESRAEQILYPSLPMGSESYHIYVLPDNTTIKPDDYSTLNGKKVGVTKGSIQEDQFRAWIEAHGVSPIVVQTPGSETESIEMLKNGTLDAFLTVDSYADPSVIEPVCKIGSSDFYFAVNKYRPDLLTDLENAMNRIQDEDKYYDQKLYEKYLQNTGSNQYLSADEQKWLEKHGSIKVGYQDNYLAFCAADKDGNLTGALKDYLEFASTSILNADLKFETICFATAQEGMDALAAGEIDCMFPANFTDYDAEQMGVVMTPALMRTEMLAVVRTDEQKDFAYKKDVKVAVNEGNPNYDLFLMDNFPDWETVYYKDTPTCLTAISKGEADCILISNYRYNNISKDCQKLKLSTVSTGVGMDYCFAVTDGETKLYSILSKITQIVPESTTNAALTFYSTEDAKLSISEFIWQNMGIVMSVVATVMLIIIILLVRAIHLEKKANAEKHQVEDLSKRVNYDALLSIRNKGAFDNYLNGLQEKIDNKEDYPFGLAVLDCNNLKQINDRHGHEKGDEYLKASCKLICTTFHHCPVFRIGGDEFAVVLINEDLENRKELLKKFDEVQIEMSNSALKEWERASIAVGVAVYNPENDKDVHDTFRRADEKMYENKRRQKTTVR